MSYEDDVQLILTKFGQQYWFGKDSTDSRRGRARIRIWFGAQLGRSLTIDEAVQLRQDVIRLQKATVRLRG